MSVSVGIDKRDHVIIELFKDRVTDEGQWLLGLHDSQFSTALKTGFQVD
jgi:hypothetical protein